MISMPGFFNRTESFAEKSTDSLNAAGSTSLPTGRELPRIPSGTVGPVILKQGALQQRTTGKVSARWVTRMVVVEGSPRHRL